ncbi:NADPH:quinone oxidoreductase family protein [Microbacterium sp. No. 7]|uniref:NADPH:quinone oxidoreductase family protein n=1 Tax=Microbacterium sp. No. 7 TaxID=1714373 RepID=UPI0006D1D20A|nr:NADPH:quinone oxidoreductase family protein [Microbacterium sp. No. 7]ALJ21907.1 hypothetical protein AOA12_19190 [Microbacterium sp. No. 7]
MRALELHAYEGPSGLRLAEAPVPVPADDEVLLKVDAIGINYPDLLLTRGQYQLKPELPMIPGCEIAGRIESAPVASGWKAGDRAFAFVWNGGFAEYAVAPLKAVAPTPAALTQEQAAAVGVNYATALFALQNRGRLEAGERVLVLGAGGGIGTAAIQIARGLGAGVIAGVQNDAQRETALEAGAEHAIVLEEGFSSRVAELTGSRGVDVVVDPLGDWIFGEAVRTLAPEGRLLVIGFAAGDIPSIKVNRLLLRNVSVVGVAFGAFLDVDPALLPRLAVTLDRLAEEGWLRPHIRQTFAFDEIPRALDLLGEARIQGKAVAVL